MLTKCLSVNVCMLPTVNVCMLTTVNVCMLSTVNLCMLTKCLSVNVCMLTTVNICILTACGCHLQWAKFECVAHSYLLVFSLLLLSDWSWTSYPCSVSSTECPFNKDVYTTQKWRTSLFTEAGRNVCETQLETDLEQGYKINIYVCVCMCVCVCVSVCL